MRFRKAGEVINALGIGSLITGAAVGAPAAALAAQDAYSRYQHGRAVEDDLRELELQQLMNAKHQSYMGQIYSPSQIPGLDAAGAMF